MNATSKKQQMRPVLFEVIALADISFPLFVWALISSSPGGDDYDTVVFLQALAFFILIVWIALFPIMMAVALRGIRSSGSMTSRVAGYFRLTLSVLVVVARFLVGIAILAMVAGWFLKR